MNIFINTPLLKSHTLKTKFDNKVLIIFLAFITALVVLGLVFIDFMKPASGSIPVNNEEIPQLPKQATTKTI